MFEENKTKHDLWTCEDTELSSKLTLFLEDEDEGEDDCNEDGSGHNQHWIEHMAPESIG